MPAPAHSHRRERAFPPPNILPSAARSVAAPKLSGFLLACSLAFDSGRLLYGRWLRGSKTPFERQELKGLRIRRAKTRDSSASRSLDGQALERRDAEIPW